MISPPRIWFLTSAVIMKQDEYYVPVYESKKRYYLERTGYGEALRGNLEACPKHEECLRKLKARAEREMRKPKLAPCRQHVDMMARKFLAKVLVSHALELYRDHEGYDVSNFRSHRAYLPVKQHPGERPPQEVLEMIEAGLGVGR